MKVKANYTHTLNEHKRLFTRKKLRKTKKRLRTPALRQLAANALYGRVSKASANLPSSKKELFVLLLLFKIEISCGLTPMERLSLCKKEGQKSVTCQRVASVFSIKDACTFVWASSSASWITEQLSKNLRLRRWSLR